MLAYPLCSYTNSQHLWPRPKNRLTSLIKCIFAITNLPYV